MINQELSALLNKELIKKAKEESIKIAILFIIVVIILKILFYKESFIVVLKNTLSLFWLFVLPGFVLLYYYYEKLNFLERIIIAVPLSAAIIGISSYYLGLAGLHVKYHGIILPIFFIIIALIILFRKK